MVAPYKNFQNDLTAAARFNTCQPHRILLRKRFLPKGGWIDRYRLNFKNGAKAFSEQYRSADNGDGEECHRPNAKRAGQERTASEKIKQFVNGFRDGIKISFLCQNKRIGYL